MTYNCVLVLALTVFGASASLISPGYVSTGFNSLNGVYGARVSDVCRCVKTVVRPHIRSEVTSIPTVQRFVRTETTPIIERIPYSVSRRIDTPEYAQGGILRGNTVGVLSGRTYSEGAFPGNGIGLSGASAFNGGFIY